MSRADVPLDLLLVLPDLGDGGPTRVATTLAAAWAAEGRRIALATLFRAAPSVPLAEGVAHLALDASEPSAWLASLPARLVPERLAEASVHSPVRALRAAIREHRPRLVLALVDRANVVAVLAARGLGIPVVVSERHDPLRNPLAVPWTVLRPPAYARSALVTANTHGALAALGGWVPRERLRWIPNPVAGPAAPVDPAAREPIVVSVARLVPPKAHDVLLDAFASLGDDLAGWRLALVGRGPAEAALRRRATALGIERRIDWVGHVEDPSPWLARASVFVLPSRHEGLPNALLEAMSAALPVVVTDGSPGPLEWVRDGETGLVAAVGDAPSLASAIARLARDAALRRRLAEAARREARACSLERVLGDWEEAFAAAARSTSAPTLRRSFGSESVREGGATT